MTVDRIYFFYLYIQDMEKTQYNRLSEEKSPYLLQHASNPVNWFPWSDEAFDEAVRLDRPVFLSIGYATCHWCHVMERESFENEELARYLNDHFIAIKVDREERPDVDELYMKALHASGQQGGWPLNMFLTPDRRPITGGTYFPPAPAYGMPSFRQVLENIDKFWKTERVRVLNSAESLTEFLGERKLTSSRSMADSEFILKKTSSDIMEHYDRKYGGLLSSGPNKFPPSLQLLFLLQRYRKNQDSELLEACEHTAEVMKRGGIYDQIGGGLCRYSTDHYWLVPHFEKMLYDNALFLKVLTELYRITSKESYREWILDIVNYLRRDMLTDAGAFASAEDADSEGVEGKFYVWDYSEFRKCLEDENFTEKEIHLFSEFWDVTEKGNFEGKNILHESFSRVTFLSNNSLNSDDFNQQLKRARNALLSKRKNRIRPLRDDKILVSWNSMMISAFAHAGMALSDPAVIQDAVNAASFIKEKMTDKNGILFRRYRDGDFRFEGQLSDYALFGISCIDLYRATENEEWIIHAKICAEIILKHFGGNSGGFYNTSENASDLIVRSGDAYDSVEPSGNSATARLFYMLMQYEIDGLKYSELLENIFQRYSGEIADYGQSHSFLLSVFDSFHDEQKSIALVEGEKNSDEFTAVKTWLDKKSREDTAVCFQRIGKEVSRILPLLENRPAVDGRTTFYICRKGACEKPLHEPDEVRKSLDIKIDID